MAHEWAEADVDLLDHRADDLLCAAKGWNVELDGLEVDTAACPYANLEQPVLVDMHQGDQLRIQGWHSDLIHTEPTQAHIALVAEHGVLWELSIDIPHDADTWDETVPAPFDLNRGQNISLHLHNHGANTYNLNTVTIAR
jgi:hypothetical protein